MDKKNRMGLYEFLSKLSRLFWKYSTDAKLRESGLYYVVEVDDSELSKSGELVNEVFSRLMGVQSFRQLSDEQERAVSELVFARKEFKLSSSYKQFDYNQKQFNHNQKPPQYHIALEIKPLDKIR